MPHLSCRGHSCPQEKRPDEKDQKSATRPRPKADFAVQASFNHRLCPLLVAALPLWVIRGKIFAELRDSDRLQHTSVDGEGFLPSRLRSGTPARQETPTTTYCGS